MICVTVKTSDLFEYDFVTSFDFLFGCGVSHQMTRLTLDHILCSESCLSRPQNRLGHAIKEPLWLTVRQSSDR